MTRVKPLGRLLAARARRDERGVAMVIVIGIMMLLILGSITAVALANSSLKQSTGHVDFERTLHLAEEGIDRTLAILQKDHAFSAGADPTAADLASPAAEKAWAMGQLSGAPVQQTDKGEFAFIRPPSRQTVYAAAWIPSRAASQRSRLVKADYIYSTFAGPQAILTGGSLELGGNAAVGGILGNVHTNGTAELVGTSATVSGNYTATGTFSENGSVSSTQVAGTSGGGFPKQVIPPVVPRNIWDLNAADQHNQSPGSWFDLCADGTARLPTGGAPCMGTAVYETTSSSSSFQGWSWTNVGGSGPRWKNNGTGPEYNSVYYVHRSNAELGGSPNNWQTTIITEPQPSSGCQSLYGDIEVGGSPKMQPRLGSLLLIAGRDLKILGSASGGGAVFGSATSPALLEAHEQVYVSGNTTIVGALVAEDACDTPGSPVNKNHVSGSLSLKYDSQLDLNLGQLIRTTLWLEL